VRISARRLALVVLGAAILGVGVYQALRFVLAVRDDGDVPYPRLEIGVVGNLLSILAPSPPGRAGCGA
jgi:hypothetical protein